MRYRKTVVGATAAAAAIAATLATCSMASASPRPAERWNATWASAMQRPVSGDDSGANWSAGGFDHQTLRQVVRVSAGGSRIRIRISNLYGTKPLRVAGATIAATHAGASIEPGTVRRLTFHRARNVTVAAGQTSASDAAALSVSSLESLTVTLYLAGATGPSTFHEDGLTTTYRATGNHLVDVGSGAFDGPTSHSLYYLTGVDVSGPARDTVVAFGDSITNGHNSTVDGNDRYSDALANRLADAGLPFGVANAGISGNTLLNELPCFGEKGVTRFQRDALNQPGVRTVILLEGANDIWDSEGSYGNCGETPRITAEQIIAGYQTLISEAHARGVRVIGATITPFKAPYMSASQFERAEAVRDQVNYWIRNVGDYDAVVDFAKAIADPTDPQELNPAYNSGDFLHPNDTGYQAIAAAFNLNDL